MRRALHAIGLLALIADVVLAARATDVTLPLLALPLLVLALWGLAPAPRPRAHLAAFATLLAGGLAASAPWQVQNLGHAMLALAVLLAAMTTAVCIAMIESARVHAEWPRRIAKTTSDDEPFDVAL